MVTPYYQKIVRGSAHICIMARPAKIICEQERSESADLRQGRSIRITPNIFFVDPDSDPDHSQNLIACSLSHLGHILKISSKSVHNLFSYLSLKITFHGSRRSRK